MSHNFNDKPSARERILLAAEAIFLTDGYDGAGIREVTEAAGVNVALVNYYFGSKRNLYLEVLRHKFSAVAVYKCSILRQKLAEQKNLTLRQTISAYVELYLGSDESVRGAQQFLRLISRQLAEDNDAMELLLEELVVPIHNLIKSTIAELEPHLDQNKLSLCVGSITGQIFHYLRFPRAFQNLLCLPEEKNLRVEMAKHIVEFSLKGIKEVPPCDCDYFPSKH